LGITTIKITACYALGCPLKRYVLAFRLQCRFWVLELNVLIRERSGLLPFLVLLWFTVKIKILQAYTSNFHTTQTTTVQQTNEYFCLRSWQCWSNRQTSLLSTVGSFVVFYRR
jgi:hypothetical protein